MSNLYTVGQIAKKLEIRTARAAYIMRRLIEDGEVIPVVDTPSVKLYDDAAFKKAKKKNKEVK